MICAIEIKFCESKKRYQKKAGSKEFHYFAEKNKGTHFKTKPNRGNFSFIRKLEIKLIEI